MKLRYDRRLEDLMNGDWVLPENKPYQIKKLGNLRRGTPINYQ